MSSARVRSAFAAMLAAGVAALGVAACGGTSSSGAGTTGGQSIPGHTGRAIFTSAGCAGCHTLSAAHATGNIGPDLDQLKPSDALVRHQVTHGGGGMPAFGGKLTSAQIAAVAAFVASASRAR